VNSAVAAARLPDFEISAHSGDDHGQRDQSDADDNTRHHRDTSDLLTGRTGADARGSAIRRYAGTGSWPVAPT
jgi:hypothetical protein